MDCPGGSVLLGAMSDDLEDPPEPRTQFYELDPAHIMMVEACTLLSNASEAALAVGNIRADAQAIITACYGIERSCDLARTILREAARFAGDQLDM